MSINYVHKNNLHTLAGPQAALPVLLGDQRAESLLDVGCGLGTWLKAAMDFGVQDVFGVDGVEMPGDQLHFPASRFRRQDLTVDWDLNRRFDVALCLEVGEHLDAEAAPRLVEALVRHSDVVFFSAACPGQTGQHHVNCQWPAYWQNFFNQLGYLCEDHVRWRLWHDVRIEPWYRQNLFVARKSGSAGAEPRIPGVIHPQMLPFMQRPVTAQPTFDDHLKQIENGRMEAGWYLTAPWQALSEKLKRRLV